MNCNVAQRRELDRVGFASECEQGAMGAANSTDSANRETGFAVIARPGNVGEPAGGSTEDDGSFSNRIGEGGIYPVLARHQREEAWAGQGIVTELQDWAERFIEEFKLDVPHVVLCVDRLPITRYGHFRHGHNGFGLRGEIAINARYLGQRRAKWEVLGTLLHELIHAWQEVHGSPGKRNHHNAEFRDKARQLGLNIDCRGVAGYASTSVFKELLRRNGVSVPDHEIAPAHERPRGGSKLKKWSCGCTNVRVAIADFRAMCLKCGNEFSSEGVVRQDEREVCARN
jgi:SprT-like family